MKPHQSPLVPASSPRMAMDRSSPTLLPAWSVSPLSAPRTLLDLLGRGLGHGQNATMPAPHTLGVSPSLYGTRSQTGRGDAADHVPCDHNVKGALESLEISKQILQRALVS